MDSGYNRELIISMFRDAKILHRIVDGQARNDVERCAAAKTTRSSSFLLFLFFLFLGMYKMLNYFFFLPPVQNQKAFD